jgi:hypothetical protein
MSIEVPYRVQHNLDAGFMRGYEPGDRLASGFAGIISCPPLDPELSPLEALYQMLLGTAEAVFVRHNRDDRPDSGLFPSISVGDVVIFPNTDGVAVPVGITIDMVGVHPVALEAADLLDQDWSPSLYRDDI